MTSLGAQQAAETAAYEKARSQPFNQINGLPSRFDFHELGKQVVTLLHQPNSCIAEHHDSGFIGEVLTNQQYFTATGQNNPYVTLDDYEEQYDSSITDAMTDAARKQAEALWGDRLVTVATRRGCLRGVCNNLREAIDERYYEQLKDTHHKYNKVKIKEYLDHLDTVWCRLSIDGIEKAKEHYYREKTEDQYTTAGMAKTLDEEAETLATDGIIISEADMKQHFLVQTRKNYRFTRQEWRDYNKKPDADRDWAATKTYFKDLEVDNNTYNNDEDLAVMRGGIRKCRPSPRETRRHR